MRGLLAALIVVLPLGVARADERAAEAREEARRQLLPQRTRRVLDHRDGQGRDLATRLGLYPYRAAAENLAMGTPDGTVVVRLWLDSPPHRANLLNAEVTHHGLARMRAADGQDYWALVLAAPR